MAKLDINYNVIPDSQVDPNMDPVEYADMRARANLERLVASATEVHDLGDCAIRLGEGASAYAGRCIRLVGTPYGEVLACLGGWNLRRWGTQKGFLEVAWGNPDMSQWDPAPGLLVPWSRVLLIEKATTTHWKARGF